MTSLIDGIKKKAGTQSASNSHSDNGQQTEPPDLRILMCSRKGNANLFDLRVCIFMHNRAKSKSNLSLYSLFYTEACNELAGPISSSLLSGNTVTFEEMLQRWRDVGNIAFDLPARDLNLRPSAPETNVLTLESRPSGQIWVMRLDRGRILTSQIRLVAEKNTRFPPFARNFRSIIS